MSTTSTSADHPSPQHYQHQSQQTPTLANPIQATKPDDNNDMSNNPLAQQHSPSTQTISNTRSNVHSGDINTNNNTSMNNPSNSPKNNASKTTDNNDNSNNNNTSTPKSPKSNIAWVSGASGIMSGFLATILLHPLEVLKIRLQGDASGRSNYRFSLKEVIRVSRKVGIYTGISANLIASMTAWGVFFGTNDYLRVRGRDFWRQYKENKNQNSANNTIGLTDPTTSNTNTNNNDKNHDNINYFGIDFVMSMCASVLAQIFTQPLWLMKTRMSLDQIPLEQSQYNDAAHQRQLNNSPYRSLTRGLIHTGKTEGIRGLYRGFSASLLGTTHGAIMMCSYSYLKEWKFINNILDNQPEWLKTIILPSYAAFLSKVIATLITYPTQVIRTAIQDHRVLVETGSLPTTSPLLAHNNVNPTPKPTTTTTTPPLTTNQPQLFNKTTTPINQPPSNNLKYGLAEATRDIWRSNGPKGFYRGVSMQVIRASLQNVVVFGVYEASRAFITHEDDHTNDAGNKKSSTNTSSPARKD